MEFILTWVAMILVVYGFVIALFLLTVKAERERTKARFQMIEDVLGEDRVKAGL